MKSSNTTVHKIAKFIRQEITYSKLKPGHHLKEFVLAKQFKVSRVPVREALRILQTEGYVDMIPNCGSFVRKISRQFVLETGIVYKLLAPVVLEAAIPKYTEQTYKKASEVLDKVESCKDFSKVGYLLWDFAKIIYKPSKMKFILSLFDEIYSHSIRLLNEIFEIKQHGHYDTRNHRRFLDLCRINRIDEAITLWADHIDKIEKISLDGSNQKSPSSNSN